MSGVGVADVTIFWGHPEVCISLALVMWAALTVERGGEAALTRAAWLLGIAIAFQPLAILGVAPVLARYPWRTWLRLSWRIVLPSVALLIAPFAASASHTWFIQVHEPFQPRYTSRTPLTNRPPHSRPGVRGGGPTRALSTVLGIALGLVVCRRRHSLAIVLFIIAVAFYIRLLLESELNGYYFWPVIGLGLLLAMRTGWVRFVVCSAATLATITLGNHRVHEIGGWWPAIMATTLVVLLSAVPRTGWSQEEPEGEVSEGPLSGPNVESQAMKRADPLAAEAGNRHE